MDLFGNVDFFEMADNNVKYPCDQSKNPWPVPTGNIHPWFGDVTDAKVQATMKSGGTLPISSRAQKHYLPSISSMA